MVSTPLVVPVLMSSDQPETEDLLLLTCVEDQVLMLQPHSYRALSDIAMHVWMSKLLPTLV